jgi:hypothetical protein
MIGRVIGPDEAVALIAARLDAVELVSRELSGDAFQPIRQPLRPNVVNSAAVERVGFDTWHEWKGEWTRETRIDLPGVECVFGELRVRGRPSRVPRSLLVTAFPASIELLSRFGQTDVSARLARTYEVGLRMRTAGAATDPGAVRAFEKLTDDGVAVALNAVTWLRSHVDLGEWTTRQLLIPGADTKWVESHETLLRRLTNRRVGEETRERPAVVHLSYVDPDYVASGGRRHDAWTAGDSHRLAYEPRIVLVVENRDCRLGFPEFAGTVVVEGEGKAAAKLAEIDWLVRAERILYWGDLDADGFGILNNLRGALAQRGAAVESVLMDGTAWGRYKHFGVDRDKDGRLLQPSRIRLPALTPDEEYCYALLATSGEVAVRRIEQERIPLADAAEAVRTALGG